MTDLMVSGEGCYPAGPRTRPEAVSIAQKHAGRGMATNLGCYTDTMLAQRRYNKEEVAKRPSTAQLVLGGGNTNGHPMALSVAPRVKPEAEDIHQKNRGTLTQIYAGYNDTVFQHRNEAVSRPKTAPSKRETMKGPIGSDPVYQKYPDPVAEPPRVKPEAESTAKLGVNGTLGKILLESYDAARKRNMQRSMKQSSHKVKDFNKSNMRLIRKTQRRREQIEANQPQTVPVKALWRAKEYQSVPSRIKTGLKKVEDVRQKAPRDQSSETQILNLEVGSQCEVATQTKIDDDGITIVVERQPRQSKASPRPSVSTPDFIKKNRGIAVSLGAQKRSKIEQVQAVRNQKKLQGPRPGTAPARGEVPEYLRQYQKQWADDHAEKVRSEPDPDCPPGHKKLDDADRREMLATLKSSKAQLEGRLATSTVSTTLRAKREKEDLLRQLAEVDEAMRVFSRRKVFVKISA